MYTTDWGFYQEEESIKSRLLADAYLAGRLGLAVPTPSTISSQVVSQFYFHPNVYKLLDVDFGCTLFVSLTVVSRAFEFAVPQIYHARCVM